MSRRAAADTAAGIGPRVWNEREMRKLLVAGRRKERENGTSGMSLLDRLKTSCGTCECFASFCSLGSF